MRSQFCQNELELQPTVWHMSCRDQKLGSEHGLLARLCGAFLCEQADWYLVHQYILFRAGALSEDRIHQQRIIRVGPNHFTSLSLFVVSLPQKAASCPYLYRTEE